MSFLFGGGGSESNLIIPEGEKPKAFQTVIPQKSYKDLAGAVADGVAFGLCPAAVSKVFPFDLISNSLGVPLKLVSGLSALGKDEA